MAEQKDAGRGSAGAGTLDRVREELEHYVEARVELMLEGVGHRLGEGARRLGEGHLVGPGGLATAVGKGGKMLREHVPTGSLLTSAASHAKDAVLDEAKDVTKDVAKGVTGEKPEKSTETGRGLTIIEDIDVGVPVREAYNQWTQFQEFGRFAKGVVEVDQQDDTTTQWYVKVVKMSRRWRGTITEQVPDQRIAWTSEGHKATTKGVVTFHPVGENLTKVLLVLEYSPKGVVGRVGSLWRAQRHRARLDLKLYRTFVMMRGEATVGWRGEVHEGEVVRTPEEVEEAEEARAEDRDEEEEEKEEEAYRDEEPEEQYDEDEDEEGEEDENNASAEDDWEDEEDEDEVDEDEVDEEGEGQEPGDRDDTRSSAP